MAHEQAVEAASIGSAEANRRFYETHAADYDETEFCATTRKPKDDLREALLSGLEQVAPAPRVLDAGGGTGNASMVLAELGVSTTLIDASPQMLARYRAKARAAGLEPTTELADLERFFAVDERRWDMIVFSSVLHHLEDPAAVLCLAANRLEPGGVLVTIFDPLIVGRPGYLLRRLDYMAWIAIHAPATLLRAVWRRLRSRLRRATAGSAEPNIGELAERHAMSGLDDERIRRGVEAAGLVTIRHQRIHDARHRWIARAGERLGQPTHFAFTFRRPPA